MKKNNKIIKIRKYKTWDLKGTIEENILNIMDFFNTPKPNFSEEKTILGRRIVTIFESYNHGFIFNRGTIWVKDDSITLSKKTDEFIEINTKQ